LSTVAEMIKNDFDGKQKLMPHMTHSVTRRVWRYQREHPW